MANIILKLSLVWLDNSRCENEMNGNTLVVLNTIEIT